MEILRTTAALGLALSLGACGSNGEQSTSSDISANKSGITRTYQYFPDGSRITHLSGSAETAAGFNTYPLDILAYCEDGELVEQSLGQTGYPGGSLVRTVGHEACKDGKLTPADTLEK